MAADALTQSGPLAQDIRELAALLSPAVHIDAGFLRNFRTRQLPYTDTGLEARFWYSELVASRSSSVITLDWQRVEGLGKAEFTASTERFQRCWRTIEALHRNLPGNLRLQEALRYAAITHAPIDEWVARIHRTLSELTDAAQRRSLGRWLKATLPELPAADRESAPVQWLAALARVELGDAPALFYPEEYARAVDIPDWLFPEREIQPAQTIGLQLTPGLLAIVEPGRDPAGATAGERDRTRAEGRDRIRERARLFRPPGHLSLDPPCGRLLAGPDESGGCATGRCAAAHGPIGLPAAGRRGGRYHRSAGPAG
jgi:hypothetical protein